MWNYFIKVDWHNVYWLILLGIGDGRTIHLFLFSALWNHNLIVYNERKCIYKIRLFFSIIIFGLAKPILCCLSSLTLRLKEYKTVHGHDASPFHLLMTYHGLLDENSMPHCLSHHFCSLFCLCVAMTFCTLTKNSRYSLWF